MMLFLLNLMLCTPDKSFCTVQQMPGGYTAQDDCNAAGRQNIYVTSKDSHPDKPLEVTGYICLLKM